MKPLLILLVLALVLPVPFLAAAQNAPEKAAGKVLLIIREAKPPQFGDVMVTKELGVMREMLQNAGYQVEIASPTAEPWGTEKATVKPDLKLHDVNVADYKAFVIPCLSIDSAQLHPDLAAIIKTAMAQGKLVAGQNMGVHMLAKAGVLKDRKYAAIELTSRELSEGTWAGTGIAKDGNIITSGTCPGMAQAFKGTEDGTTKLMEAVIAELKTR